MNRRWSVAVVLMLVALGALGGCENVSVAPEPPMSAERQAEYLESFDKVWETVRDKHWDPKIGGLDWEAVRGELRPRMEQAQLRSEALEILNDMVERLGISHMAVIPDGSDELDEEETAGGAATPGIDVRVLNGQVVVTRVEPGSAAAAAQVGTGWVIDSVKEKPLAPWLEKSSERLGDSSLRGLRQRMSILHRLVGTDGSTVRVDFVVSNDRRRSLHLKRLMPKDPGVAFGHFPAIPVNFRSRALADGVGYIAFDAFMNLMQTMPAFETAVKKFKADKAPGIILDLRGNPGGIAIMSTGMAGWFVGGESHFLGTMTTRQMKLKFTINPRMEPYEGPLAILIDECSASTSEIMAGGMRDIGRARIFGTRTAGAALPSMVEKLPSGDLFQYVVADYFSKGGQKLEGEGVEPDENVPLSRDVLLEGRDPVVEAAQAWIRTH